MLRGEVRGEKRGRWWGRATNRTCGDGLYFISLSKQAKEEVKGEADIRVEVSDGQVKLESHTSKGLDFLFQCIMFLINVIIYKCYFSV